MAFTKATVPDYELCFGCAFVCCVFLVVAGWFTGRHVDCGNRRVCRKEVERLGERRSWRRWLR